jgi:hypothetical protein
MVYIRQYPADALSPTKREEKRLWHTHRHAEPLTRYAKQPTQNRPCALLQFPEYGSPPLNYFILREFEQVPADTYIAR